MYPLDDTIVAVASPPGGAARAVVRLSGPMTGTCVRDVFLAEDGLDPVSTDRPSVTSGMLRLPELNAPLPCDLYFWPERQSYTGQPVAEIHTLGSPPLLEAAVQTLCRAGARLAEPGEFTLRAFLSGRIDLTQAEAVRGVIDAADSPQLDVALRQLAGGLAGPLQEFRDALIELLAHLEAGLDFADEDLPLITAEQLTRQLADAQRIVGRLAAQMSSRANSRQQVSAVLVGRPNVGKSSLFNALARDAGALVSERPGTTRDYLTAELDLDGVKCQLIDTAGVADGPPGGGEIDRAAQAAAAEQARCAQIRILCHEAGGSPLDLASDEAVSLAEGPPVVVLTKADLATGNAAADVPGATATSSVTGQGIGELRDALRRAVLAVGAGGADVVAGTAARCRESVRLAGESLRRARAIVENSGGEELVAAEIRVALDELGKVAGAVYTDDVLDRIFSRFCIGK